MTLPSVADAAANNAAWCDAVCAAHGAAGERFPSHWQTRGQAPPLYPNLVTLDAAVGTGLATVRALARTLVPRGWAAKDSFAALPLADEGFAPLFEAEWIARAPLASERASPGRWHRVRSDAALADWESAWGESPGGTRIFRPALLAHRDVAILAGVDRADAIVAGVVAHRAGGVVGISNRFGPARDGDAWRAACVGAAAGAFPGLPLVGYESGAALVAARSLGFAALGPLRIWRKG